MPVMAAIAGRNRRPSTGGNHALLQARVDPEVRELAHRGAAARGVSVARYIESLIREDKIAAEYDPADDDQQLRFEAQAAAS